MALYKKFQICSDSKTVSRFGICITLWAKKSPTSFPESSGLPKYNELGQISWCSKIDNFKQGQILKIVSFTERGSLTDNNGTITNVQLLMVIEKINFFKNFKNLLMGGGGPRRKTEKFWPIEKKIIDLYELDNSEEKNFFEKKFSK